MSAGRVVLHVGMPKTGSTAVQVALVRNRDLLISLGVTYPPARSDRAALAGRLMSGNGVSLLPYVTSQEPMPEAVEEIRRQVAESGTPFVLWSSEALYYRLRPDRLGELAAGLASDGVELTVTGFVRDIAGHAVSSYSEMVKGALLTRSFHEFVDGSAGPPAYRPALRRCWGSFLDVLGPDAVTVRRYESHRQNLFAALLSGLADLENSGVALPHDGVNRSMTARELVIMREVNKKLSDPREARLISGTLISAPPVGDEAPGISEEGLALLERMFTDDVEWMNSTFLAHDPMSVTGGATVVPQDPGAETLTREELDIVEKLLRSTTA